MQELVLKAAQPELYIVTYGNGLGFSATEHLENNTCSIAVLF